MESGRDGWEFSPEMSNLQVILNYKEFLVLGSIVLALILAAVRSEFPCGSIKYCLILFSFTALKRHLTPFN